MAAQWDFTQHMQSASRTQKEEYSELYKRAREATEEAQRQGNAQLKAAIEAASAGPASPICIGPLSSTFNNSLFERAYCRFSSEKRDVMPMVFQFLMRTALICLIFQTRTDLVTSSPKDDVGVPHILTRLVASLWIAALFAAMLIVPFQSSSWCEGGRGVVLLLASSVLWLGEVVAVLASCSHLALDIAHIFSQCVFSSIIHRAPFSSHLKARLFGFGLQTIMALAIVSKVYEALPSILYFSLSHSLGVALAYMSHHHSIPCFTLDKKLADLQASSLQARKRALGGFAGGFAGVSSLKCPYPPSIWAVSSSSYSGSSREGYASEVSCSSSSTVDNSFDRSSRQHYFACPSSSETESIQPSNALHSAGSGCEHQLIVN